MKRAQLLFIISLLVIPLLFHAKSMAQSLTSSQYPEEVIGYSQQYSFFPFLTERFSNTHLNPSLWNYDAQAFWWLSGTSLPLSQYYPDYCYLYYNQPGNFWYGDFYHQLKQSLRNPVPGESPEEPSIDENSGSPEAPSIDGNPEGIKIITEDDHGKTFTFHVGDEFIVKLRRRFWIAFFGTAEYAWSEGEEINLENGYGFINTNGDRVKEVSELHEEFHYQAIQPGENELIINCFMFPSRTPLNGPVRIPLSGPSFLNPDQEMADDITIVGNFKIIIKIIY